MSRKSWSLCWLVVSSMSVLLSALLIFRTDPFFHYRAPLTDIYYYRLEDERGQNDGISRHYEYDAVITGSSITRNFKVSEADSLFDADFIKIPYSGAAFDEIYAALEHAFSYNPEIRLVIRSLDENMTFLPGERDGSFPYLYDNNRWNDVFYLLNRTVFFRWSMPMLFQLCDSEFSPGIMSLDDYSTYEHPSGLNSVSLNGVTQLPAGVPIHLSPEDAEIVRNNLQEHVISLAVEHPNVDFYCFFPPYSILFWQEKVENGTIYEQFEMNTLAAEMLLRYDNIHLCSFGSRMDIITDVNNYSDSFHYERWVNSLILKWILSGDYELSPDSFQQKLSEERDFYINFDYNSLRNQEDYECDLFAAARVNQELTGAEPILLNESVFCNDRSVLLPVLTGQRFLCFTAKQEDANSTAAVRLQDESGHSITVHDLDPESFADQEWHSIVLEIPDMSSYTSVCFDQLNNSGWYIRDIILY